VPEGSNPNADQLFMASLLYVNIPQYFTLSSNKSWNKRVQGSSVYHEDRLTTFRKSSMLGRVYGVHPKQVECYYLRLLLHHKRAPTSFEDLRTVHGILCSTYREACNMLGLLEDDQHWILCMEEASECRSSPAIRTLFGILLTACELNNPQALWERFKEAMTEDILHQCRLESNIPDLDFNDNMFNQALIQVDTIVNHMGGSTLDVYGLPIPIREDFNQLASDLLKEFSYDQAELLTQVNNTEPLLTDDQREAIQRQKELERKKGLRDD
jgi:hypothetical protein